MITLSAAKAQLTITKSELITSGSVGVFSCQFELNEDWDNFTPTVVFRAGSETRSVLLGEDNSVDIPWEVLAKSGLTLHIGLYGTSTDGKILPTIWANAGTITGGAYLGDDAFPPTPGAYEQIYQIAKSAQEIAQSVRDDAESGKFGGGGEISFTAECDSPIAANTPVMLIDNFKVKESPGGKAFHCFSKEASENGTVDVIISGIITVSYSGTKPSVGTAVCSADGNGGLKISSSGASVRILSVDADNKLITIKI